MKVLLSLCWIISLVISFWLGFSYSDKTATAKTGSDYSPQVSGSANLPQTTSRNADAKPVEKFDTSPLDKSAEQSPQYRKMVMPEDSDTVKADKVTQNHQPRTAQNQPTEAAEPTSTSASKLAGKVPAPFDQVLLNAKGSFIDQFNRFDEDPVDYEWSVQMQQRITDYVFMHESGGYIELESVSCKTSLCEIRGFDHHGKVWSLIAAGMANQDWWPFNSAHGSRNFTEEHGQYFYSLVEVVD